MTQSPDERKDRLKRLEALKEQGINPYPAHFERTHTLAEARELKVGTVVTVAGRLMSRRVMGKIAFCHLQDTSDKLQIVFKAGDIPETELQFFVDHFDTGDFIGITGEIFTTQKGELSILVKEYQILSKSLLPLPDKHHGLQDEDLKLRKRYLDLIMNPELRELFVRRAKFWTATRNFLQQAGFLEVETPVLETTTGGADAEPFVTHHNALDIDVFLRISTGELWQKRLMIAGFEKTFEIGRQFRNEGMSREHLQDYTQMECYWAYANYQQMMKLTQDLYRHIAQEAYGTLKFTIGDHEVDLGAEWTLIDYRDIILEKMGIDILNASQEAIAEKLISLKVKPDTHASRGRLIDQLWKQLRPQISGPAFLINHPVDVSPLAKRNPEKPELVERFQIILAGSEMGNGYSELNDPIDQAERFKEQSKLRDAGDKEAQMPDREFVEALEHGMPPVAGFGFSERLFSFLENKTARECQLFPLVKPKEE